MRPKDLSSAAILRQKAEQQLKDLQSRTNSLSSETDLLKLIHELQVHQIELEMQNEALVVAKEKVEIAEAKYTELYDFAPSGYLSLTKDGDITELNFAAAKMLGKNRLELMNKRFVLFTSHDTRAIFNHFFDRVCTGEEKQTCDITIETEGNSPIYVTVEGIVSPNKKICNLILVDITERKRLENQLQGSLHYLKNIIDAVALPIFVKNETHQFCLANHALCEMFNMPLEKIIGTTGFEYLQEDQLKVFITKDKEVFETGQENTNEEVFTDVKGNVSIIVTKKTLYTDVMGTKFLVGVINDITERKKAEQEAIRFTEAIKRQNAELIDFTNIIAHNLRAPLVNISLLIDYLEESKDDTEKRSLMGMVKPILLDLMSEFDVLVESIQVSYDKKIKKDKIILDDCLATILKGFEIQINACGAEIKHDFTKVPVLYFPTNYIKSIFSNLISNALKYQSPDRKLIITIKTEKINNAIVLSVADNGLGINLERYKSKIFKIRKTFHKHQDARGFGLFMTRTQVEAMGGKIWVESQLNEGSIFFIEFKNTSI